MDFSDSQIERYARHIVLREIGGAGQQKLLNARVLVVGAGGLGSPLILYLAAAGVGTIGIVDDDQVTLSNLQRQIVHPTARIGRPKTESAAESVAALNPDVRVERHAVRLAPKNALELIGAYDLVADGSDNVATRFLVNDASFFARRPLVSAAILRFDGQITTFKAYEPGDHPCFRCLFPEPPSEAAVPTCAQAGVLGAVAGVMGALQGVEVVKELLGLGEGLSGRLLIYEALGGSFRRVTVHRDRSCPLCGEHATIRALKGAA